MPHYLIFIALFISTSLLSQDHKEILRLTEFEIPEYLEKHGYSLDFIDDDGTKVYSTYLNSTITYKTNLNGYVTYFEWDYVRSLEQRLRLIGKMETIYGEPYEKTQFGWVWYSKKMEIRIDHENKLIIKR